jgi:8-oxo-dGTP diphosphatase
MKNYVAGFLFGNDDTVWLIRKTKPAWQKGKLNGIGGKVEEGETTNQAMNREFIEEASLDIGGWTWFLTLTDDKEYAVEFFYAFSNDTPVTMTDEILEQVNWKSLPDDVIPNLNWIIPMARSFEKGEHAQGFIVREFLPIA